MNWSIEFLEGFVDSSFFGPIIIFTIIIVGFLAWKKGKKEKAKKRRREEEVKNLIKEHLKKKDKIFNVTIVFLDIHVRSSKEYRNRDVFDVIFEARNEKKKNKIICQKAFEIEGIATVKPHPDDPKDIIVKWQINEEYEFEKHRYFLKAKPKSKFNIYIRAITQRNRRKYVLNEIQKLNDWKKKEKEISDKVKKIKLDNEDKEEVFRPQVKKEK